MLVMSAIIGSEKTVDEQEKNFLTEAEVEKFLRSTTRVNADVSPQLIGPLHRDRFRSNER